MKLAEIETTRLHLRPLTTDDVDDIHRLWIDPYIRKYLWDDEVITRERVASIIDASLASFADNGFGLWAVFPGGEQTLIGFCGFWFFHDPPQLQLLYGIAQKEWGKGLAAEVARSMIRYGFEELGFDRIEASTDAANGASLRVMEKAGMVYEKRIYKGGLDTVYCAITRENYQADNLDYFVTMNGLPEMMERKTTSIRIRIAVADDAPSIAAVLHESFLEYESSYTQEAFIATTPAASRYRIA